MNHFGSRGPSPVLVRRIRCYTDSLVKPSALEVNLFPVPHPPKLTGDALSPESTVYGVCLYPDRATQFVSSITFSCVTNAPSITTGPSPPRSACASAGWKHKQRHKERHERRSPPPSRTKRAPSCAQEGFWLRVFRRSRCDLNSGFRALHGWAQGWKFLVWLDLSSPGLPTVVRSAHEEKLVNTLYFKDL